MDTLFYIWIAVAAFAIIIEGVTAALVTIWFFVGGLVAAGMAYAGCPLWSQVVAFVVVSGLLFLLLYKPLKKWLDGRTTDADIGTDNRLRGSIGIVVQEINLDKQTGRVKVGDVSWRAQSVDGDVIEKGSTVVVEEVKGTLLYVKKK